MKGRVVGTHVNTTSVQPIDRIGVIGEVGVGLVGAVQVAESVGIVGVAVGSPCRTSRHALPVEFVLEEELLGDDGSGGAVSPAAIDISIGIAVVGALGHAGPGGVVSEGLNWIGWAEQDTGSRGGFFVHEFNVGTLPIAEALSNVASMVVDAVIISARGAVVLGIVGAGGALGVAQFDDDGDLGDPPVDIVVVGVSGADAEVESGETMGAALVDHGLDGVGGRSAGEVGVVGSGEAGRSDASIVVDSSGDVDSDHFSGAGAGEVVMSKQDPHCKMFSRGAVVSL